jgi:hypothetical protein
MSKPKKRFFVVLMVFKHSPSVSKKLTLDKLTGLRGTKVLLGVLFEGVDLPNSY